MDRAEEKALEFYPILFSERNGLDDTMNDRRISFENGYREGYKDAINENMTTEQKAKAYDEAIERTAKLVDDGCLNRMTGEHIFPELAESEDERIRKEIIEYFNQFENRELRGVDISDWITWLEKQKPEEYPQAVIENAISFLHERNDGMPIEEAREIVNAVTSVLNPKHWVREKPAEWSEGDEMMQSYLVNYFLAGIDESKLPFTAKWAIEWLNTLPKRSCLQSKREWSEEGKERIRQNGRLDVCYNPEKYGLCHKTDWSEEDEKMRQSIIDGIKNLWPYDHRNKCIAWLKSLRPQPKPTCPHYSEGYGCDISPTKSCATCDKNPLPHWKPSEEQMGWLKSAVKLSTDKPHIHGIIISLYEQLKRL